ncbi:MAG: tetratricopeptide repeat protein, partial [Abditibacteriaceae bacterium]
NPKSPESIFQLALIIMQRGTESHWVSANEQFGAALQTRPDLLAAIYNSALCQYLLGFREPAADLFQVVVAQDPAVSLAYYLIGVGHALAKRYDQALSAWMQALRFESRSIDLLANIAFAYYKKNDWKQSVKYFQLAHTIAPDDATLLSGMGLAYARDQMFDRAIDAFKKSLQLDPHSASTHSNLGLSFYLHKDVEEAIKHWRLVSQLDASYAKKMEQQEERNFDDSMVDLRELDWKNRIIKLAPSLPKPRTKLVPGFNMRRRRFIISDPTLKDIYEKKQELEKLNRRHAFLNR